MSLTVTPPSYTGYSCPQTFTFDGTITVRPDVKSITYRFIRSDGAMAPTQTATPDASGTIRVSTTWTLGGSGTSYSGWEAVEVLAPQDVTSNHAQFSLTCLAIQ